MPDKVILCVSDEGPGIAQSDLPHIFDRFYRAPEEAKKTKGAGLGLYLARSIIEAHGGQIWAGIQTGSGHPFLLFTTTNQFHGIMIDPVCVFRRWYNGTSLIYSKEVSCLKHKPLVHAAGSP